ncbi:MAG TPA: Crp/Fnr family transcriptional regulator [Alphaproteobacteria bacterium]|jgi:CRP-like cAMP-binding protein|nr:Crp/Fnr family transcriptional regulator [Alphaproteobacteria bacterium]
MTDVQSSANRLLSALPTDEYRRLEPHLEHVTLSPRQVLFDEGTPVRRSYFPTSGFISYVAVLEDGPVIEAATVGPEGVAGAPLFIEDVAAPITAVVQMPCTCATISARSLNRVLPESPRLAALMRGYSQALLGQTLQNVACNTVHTVGARMAKWLLLSSDRSHATEFLMTQEFLGQMLGVARQTVAKFAGALQDEGIITYRRGKVSIRSRKRLAETACSCYQAIRRRYDTVLPHVLG